MDDKNLQRKTFKEAVEEIEAELLSKTAHSSANASKNAKIEGKEPMNY